ncbi:hypothetical protein IHE45_07G026900 [Dioscorea alata]|uniref:Uncharacterized protein n=1 Tax=Dioscorea alata TaxID=55571 RepID=A0ACB7VQE7_DIOAL|nr:hypothetical protein IHE45_07G026900 [Dioscorea alata]
MAPQGDHLEKVAKEAFDMLDEHLGKKREREVYSYTCQTQYFSTPPRKEVMIDKSEALKRQIFYHYNSKPVGAKKEGEVIDSNEAAKTHGGVLLVGFPPQRKRSGWAF